MGCSNLYYYSWYPTVSTNATTESTVTSDCLSTVWSPGRKSLWLWLLIVGVIIILTIAAIGFNLTPSSSSSYIPPTASARYDTADDVNNSKRMSQIVGTAETDCIGCSCKESSFFPCNTSGHNFSVDCIPRQLICDGRIDCIKTGRDEENCITLSNSPIVIQQSHFLEKRENINSEEGYVLVQVKGVWYPYCSSDWSIRAFRNICDYLNMSNFLNGKALDLNEFNQVRMNFGSDDMENHSKLILVRNEEDISTSHSNVVDVHETDFLFTLCKIAYLKCSK